VVAPMVCWLDDGELSACWRQVGHEVGNHAPLSPTASAALRREQLATPPCVSSDPFRNDAAPPAGELDQLRLVVRTDQRAGAPFWCSQMTDFTSERIGSLGQGSRA